MGTIHPTRERPMGVLPALKSLRIPELNQWYRRTCTIATRGLSNSRTDDDLQLLLRLEPRPINGVLGWDFGDSIDVYHVRSLGERVSEWYFERVGGALQREMLIADRSRAPVLCHRQHDERKIEIIFSAIADHHRPVHPVSGHVGVFLPLHQKGRHYTQHKEPGCTLRRSAAISHGNCEAKLATRRGCPGE